MEVTRHTRRRRGRGEDGTIMLLALVLVVAFGLVAVAVGNYASANMRDTVATRERTDIVQAASGGARLGIARLQADPTFCGAQGSTMAVVERVNDLDVEVTCTATSGSSAGIGGFTLASTGTDGSAQVLATSGSGMTINGPSYLHGNSQGSATVVGGDLYFAKPGGSCNVTTGVDVAPPNVHLVKGNGNCEPAPAVGWDAIPDTLTAPPLPASVPATLPSTGGVTPPAFQVATPAGACAVFVPGRYTEPPQLSPVANHFVSGIYYFEGIGELDLSTGPITVGAPGPTEANVTGQVPCVDDAVVPGAEAGTTGAVFILGGPTRLVNGGGAGLELEMFARRCQSAPCVLEGVSVITVPDGGSNGFAAWQKHGNRPAFEGGGFGKIVVHGQIWAMNSRVEIGVTPYDGGRSMAYGGVAAGRIELAGSNGRVELEHLPSLREVTITAVAVPADGGGGAQQVVATVTVGTGTDPGVAIASWATAVLP